MAISCPALPEELSVTSSENQDIVLFSKQKCLVCEDTATGRHYGVTSCEGCKGFFKRSIRKNLMYACRDGGDCLIDRTQRNRCRRCRLNKCLKMGMKKSAVQCERSQNMSKDKQMDPVGPFQSKLAERCDFAFNMEFPEDKQLTMDYVYELATRLLFHSIDWVRFTHSFNNLNPNDQVILLKSCWTDVFLLSFVQCAKVCPLEATLNLMKQNTEKGGNESNQEMNMVNYINKVIDLLLTLERLDLTATEFALLKLICLFNPDVPGLTDVKEVEEMQETAQSELQEFVKETNSLNQSRFARILLRLPAIKTISSKKVEEMFFSPLIGEVRIDHILPTILSSSCNASNKQ